nr:zinc finger, CCHC-type [Tanacetum cinerariifolium]
MVVAAQNTNNMTNKSILLAEKLMGLISQTGIAILGLYLVKAFHACKQEDGQSVSSYLLKMKSYLDTLAHLGYAMPKELGVGLILNSLNKDYDQFIQNYNMHSTRKTITELHAMLKLHEKGIPKKAETPDVLAIRKGTTGNGGVQNRVVNENTGQARQIKCYNCNGGHDTAIDEDVVEPPVQDLELNVDNVFQADECDAFNSDVDEAPTAQTMFMANLSSADPVYDEAGPSYDSKILSEVHEYDNNQDVVCEHHEAHEMHHDIQPNCVVDSNADDTSYSNMIPYDQYVKDNVEPVLQSNVSFVPNDAYMMIINEIHEQAAHVFLRMSRTK